MRTSIILFVAGAVLSWADAARAQCSSFGATTNLNDGAGYLWDIDGHGRTLNGTVDAYDIGQALSVDGVPFVGAGHEVEMGGRQVVATGLVGGLAITRKAFVPADDAWARFVDVLDNPTPGPITATVRIETNLGSNDETVITSTGDGDAAWEGGDRWVATDDADGAGIPSLVHNLWGPGGVAPPESVSTSVFECASPVGVGVEWVITIPPGGRVALLHFAAQHASRAEAHAAGAYLDALPPATTAGLGAAELDAIVNWRTCGLDDLDGDGFSCTLGDCDDTDASIHPGAAERCDGVDSNCDARPEPAGGGGDVGGGADLDGDGLADACDDDDDGDGLPDGNDPCPKLASLDNGDLDGDGAANACDEDRDGDGVGNALDACPDRFDPEQIDRDGDGCEGLVGAAVGGGGCGASSRRGDAPGGLLIVAMALAIAARRRR